MTDLPKRVIVDQHGHYWRDYGDYLSMPPVSDENVETTVDAVFERPYLRSGAIVEELFPAISQVIAHKASLPEYPGFALVPVADIEGLEIAASIAEAYVEGARLAASSEGGSDSTERPALNFDDYRHNAELDALWADPDPETDEGQRLWRFFREGVLHPTELGIRDFGQRVCQIEVESRYPGPNRDPLGIWRGKCGHVWDCRDEDTDVCPRCAALNPESETGSAE